MGGESRSVPRQNGVCVQDVAGWGDVVWRCVEVSSDCLCFLSEVRSQVII